MNVYSSISSEYNHVCVYICSTERALCQACISDEERRLMRHERTHYSRSALCECELQGGHNVDVCSVCEEIKHEIKFIQSEIIQISAKHAMDIVQTFTVNPTFQQTLEQYAFRCRMMTEFLLRQRMKMSEIPKPTASFPRIPASSSSTEYFANTHEHRSPYEFYEPINPIPLKLEDLEINPDK